MSMPPSNHIVEPREVDVLCGRGGMSNHHPGNEWYRRLIRSNRPLYRACRKHTKLLVSKAIVQAVDQQGGRFLERNRKNGYWFPVSYKRAVDKTSQGLRERDREGEGGEGGGKETTLSHVPDSFSGKSKEGPNLADLAAILPFVSGGPPAASKGNNENSQEKTMTVNAAATTTTAPKEPIKNDKKRTVTPASSTRSKVRRTTEAAAAEEQAETETVVSTTTTTPVTDTSLAGLLIHRLTNLSKQEETVDLLLELLETTTTSSDKKAVIARQEFCSHGGCDHLVRVMSRQADKMDLQTKCCHLISAVIAAGAGSNGEPTAEQQANAFLKAGIAKPLVDAMATFPHEDFQVTAAMTLWQLARAASPKYHECLAQANVASASLLQAMKSYTRMQQLQQAACAILRILSATQPQAVTACLPELLNSLRDFPEEPQIQQDVCMCLKQLASFNAQTKLLILELGAGALLAETHRRYMFKEENSKETSSTMVVRDCARNTLELLLSSSAH